ncbi:MAG TPA: class I SAM-dependent methyltransferase, partial [Pseudomonadales bacterium]|nr:class I SAM-dependent methyltransferase [Pseudomonadales bacterium]
MYSQDRFDAAYYRRFYRNPRTRATTPRSVRRQAAFIAAYLRHLEVPVQRVLDIGCGLGWMLAALGEEFPKARTTGVEYSEYVCAEHGWTQGSVTDFRARTPFDLVVCNDVLPSLDDAACRKAIANLARLCRGALYLGVLTKEDRARCDRTRTDLDVHVRSVAWYRAELAKRFVAVGGG